MANSGGKTSAELDQFFAQKIEVQGREILIIDPDEKPLDAFQKLIAAGVLSAPVRETGSLTTFAGFLSLQDLVDLTVYAFEEVSKEEKDPTSKRFLEIALQHKVVQQAKWQDYRPTRDSEFDRHFSVQYLARRNPLVAVSPDDTLGTVVGILASNGGDKIHRVPVVRDGTIVDIISQSTIIAALQSHAKDLHSTLNVPVTAAAGSGEVVCVQENEPAIKAYQLMKEHKISAVGVMDANGRLTGCISGTDLKLYLAKPSFQYLRQSAMEFMKGVRKSVIDTTRFPIVTVSAIDTLQRAIGKLAATRMHRLFITKSSENMEPVGVVSLTDICRFLSLSQSGEVEEKVEVE